MIFPVFFSIYIYQFNLVQSLTCVWFFAAPWTVACQASLSFTISRSLPKPMSIELVMPSNHPVLCHPLLLLPSIFPSIRVFSNESALCIRWPNIGVSASTAVLPMNAQDWSALGWTGWSPCGTRNPQESSPAPWFENIQVFGTQLSLWSNSHICTWLLEKP